MELYIDNVLVLEPKGAINANSAPAFAEVVLSIVEAGTGRLVIDFDAVAYVTSTGFQKILATAQRANAKNCLIAACNMRNTVRRLSELAGMDTVLPIHDCRDAAVNSVRHSFDRPLRALSFLQPIAADYVRHGLHEYENLDGRSVMVPSNGFAKSNIRDD